MEQKSNQPLLLERGIHWLACRFQENKVPFFASVIFGLLAYMFAFTNKLINHDEVQSLFLKGATVDSGRWGLGALDSIFPNYSMPWIYGILTIALMAVSVCIILRVFSVNSRLLQVLLAGSIVVFPSLIGLFGYMFTSCSFALSFLMAVIAVWFLQGNPKLGFLPALGCMVFSLSIYQSYIAVAASLLVLVLIRRLLHGEKAAPVIRCGVFYVVFLALSLGLYYGATLVVFQVLGIGFNSYASGNVSFSLLSIPAGIVQAYRSFFLCWSEGFLGLIPTVLSRRVHCVCFAAVGILLLVWAVSRKEKKASSILLLLALIAVLPLAVNCMYLFTTADSIHTLVLYSFAAVYILAVVVADACIPLLPQVRGLDLCRRAALDIAACSLAVIVIINTYIANESYLNLYLRYENAYAFYTSLIADIKMVPEFDEDTRLAIIGDWEEPGYYDKNFAFTRQLTGIRGFSPDSYSKERFLEYYLGFPIPMASGEEIAEITASPEFEEMAVYPYYGSMRMIGDVLTVKLSK